MRPAEPRVLLVEGDTERRVLPFVIEENGIPWPKQAPAVMIHSYGGVEDLLAPGEIETRLKASGLTALGVIVDADEDAQARWRSIRGRVPASFPLPEQLPKDGVVVASPTGVRFGAWVMPDNQSRGMLETFLCFLRPEANEPLLKHARTSCLTARDLGATVREVHLDKAEIHAWLAWHDPPGLQLHTAVMCKLLTPRCEYSAPFITWFRALFEL